jgi:hypothetical protein
MDKNGWGLRAELMVILMFLMCLVVATLGLNKMGLIGTNLDDIGSINTNKNTNETYSFLEQKLTNAASEYVNKFYGASYIEDTLIIRYSSLYYNGYITKLVDNNDKECSGYVVAEKVNSNIIYYPYIKCSNYKTNGYDSSKDW